MIKKIFLPIVAIGFTLVSSNMFSAVSASEQTEAPQQTKWVDLDNDGLVDKDKLSKEEKEKSDKRTKEIEEYFGKIAELESMIKALEERLKVEDDKQLTKEIDKLKAELEHLEKNTEKNIGLKKIENDSSGEISIMSTNTNFDQTGKIYMDVFTPGQWVARADWDWSSGWAGDRTGTGDVGKKDGFGIVLDERIDIYSHSLKTYWSYDGRESTPGAIYNNKSSEDNGWGWTWQDKISGQTTASGGTVRTYNSGSGMGILYFKFENTAIKTGTVVEIAAEYGHTWNTADVTGFSFSLPLNITVNFNTTSSKWSDEENWPITL